MTFQNIVKDLGQVYQRLFDHSPAIQSESGYFYSEFEVNQRHTEFDHLLQTSHLVNEAVETDLEGRLRNCNLDKMASKVEAVAAMLERTVEKGNKGKKEYVDCVRENQEKEWESFAADIDKKRTQVDSQVEEHLQELETHFQSVESGQLPPS